MNQSNRQTKKPEVLIVGGGWAGLATGVVLSHNGIPVHLVEASKQLGGRARCVRFGDIRVDNGQHMLMGSYQHMIRMARYLGFRVEDLFVNKPLQFHSKTHGYKDISLKASPLFAPLNLLLALLKANGLSFAEKASFLKLGRCLRKQQIECAEEETVHDFLTRMGFSDRMKFRVWQPVCLALLNTDIESASAILFLVHLKRTLTRSQYYSRILFPKFDLGTMIPEPAANYIETRGGIIQLGLTADKLVLDGNTVKGVLCEEQMLSAKHIVLALPWHRVSPVLTENQLFAETRDKIARLESQPITTVYFRFPKKVPLPNDLIAVEHCLFQWLASRRHSQQPDIVAAIIIGKPGFQQLDNLSLEKACLTDIRKLYPKWPAPVESKVVREPDANLVCNINVNRSRPDQTTAVSNLYLAGDYTDTGLPPSLESAVKSGFICANHIMKNQPSV